MKIHFYNNKAEKNRIAKEDYLINEIELTGTLKTGTSIINPTILINMTGNPYFNYNYMYIEEFKRYYFINDVVAVNNQLWSISAHVDVLQSYVTEIFNTRAFITRQESYYNPLIEDNLINFKYNKSVTEYEPETTSSVNLDFSGSTGANNYIITCFNNQTLHSALETQSVGVLPNVSQAKTGVNLSSHSYAINYIWINTLLTTLALDDTKASYVTSLMIYPFDMPILDNLDHDLYLGNEILKDSYNQNIQCKLLQSEQSKYFINADFTITGDNFLDYEPYSRYEIYLPYCSWFTLNAEQVLNKRLNVVYVFNFRTGNAQVSIIDVTDNKLILTTTAQVGVNFPINTTNARELETQHNANNLNLGINLISSGLTIAGGYASGNALTMAGGVLSGARSVTGYITSENQLFERAQCTILDGNMGLYNPQKVRIRITRNVPVSYNNEYFKLHGRPLNQMYYIGDLETEGYTEVGAVHLEEFENATSTELDEIENLLKSGVIL